MLKFGPLRLETDLSDVATRTSELRFSAKSMICGLKHYRIWLS